MPPFLHETPRTYKNEKSASGLVDAAELTDLEERLRNPHVDPREFGAAGDSTGEAGTGTDDTEPLEKAIAAAIEQKRPLFIPEKMRTAGPLKANTNYFDIFGLGDAISQIVPDNSTFDALTIGPGAEGSGNRRCGTAQGFAIAGGNANKTAAGAASVTGKAALKLDGMRLYRIKDVQVKGSHDIGFDLVHNCYGTVFDMARAELGACRVGLNLRTGAEHGEDILLLQSLLSGEVAALHMASGKHIWVYGGQLSASRQNTVEEDLRGAVILGKEYTTGGEGSDCHIHLETSIEYFKKCWGIRTFKLATLEWRGAVNCGSENQALGVFKASNFSNSYVVLRNLGVVGDYSLGSGIVVRENTGGGRTWDEKGTYKLGALKDKTGEFNALVEPLFKRAKLSQSVGWRDGNITRIQGAELKVEGGALKVSFDEGSTWKTVKVE